MVSERLITIEIGIGRDGSVFQDTQTHGNDWADVYRGIHAVRDEIDRLIADRRECPFNPKNTGDDSCPVDKHGRRHKAFE
jgi:hypothetical protein